MYVKLVGNGASITGGSGAWATLFENIRGLCTGTITSTSQLNNTIINPSQSVITGTAPTSGMYAASSPTSAAAYSTLVLEKYHYARGQNSNAFQARSRVVFYYDTTFGFRVRYTDNTGANMYPYATSDYYSTSSTSTTVSPSNYKFTDANSNYDLINASGISVIHMIITDHIFVFQIQTTGVDTVKDYYTCILSDLEYLPAIDNYAYNSNSRYTPQVFSYWLWLNCMDRAAAVASAAAAGAAHGVYRQNYLDQFGTFRTTVTGQDVTSSHWAPATNATYNYPVLEGARCANRIYQVPVSSGEFAHQLIPVEYNGHSDLTDNFGDPRRGKFMSFYRTSDDVGFTGDLITNGSQNYRIFRIHKSGSTVITNGTYNACYAFPENNIPFA